MPATILMIEDDPAIARMVRNEFKEAEYELDIVHDGLTGLATGLGGSYSLVIIDVMLPGLDGWMICQRLRSAGRVTPILMLTARDSAEDQIKGLELGADDYLPKPFDFRVLLARVRALLRRDKVHRVRRLTIADLMIDTSSREVSRNGKQIGLSNRQYELLEALATSEGRILTRSDIQERVWRNEQSSSNTVDVYIGALRKKVDAEHPVKLIQTIHGKGYTLRQPQSDQR